MKADAILWMFKHITHKEERIMELRTAASPKDVKHYTTKRLREEFLIQDLFQADQVQMIYSHIDRIITGSATPVTKALELTAGDELRAEPRVVALQHEELRR